MRRAQNIILGILIILASFSILILVDTGIQAYQAWKTQPLGPVLDYPTPLQIPATWTAGPNTPLPTLTPVPVQAWNSPTPGNPFLSCSDLPPIMLLGIGADSRKDDYRYGRADVIRAIRIDFRDQRVTVLAFPRDLWVRIPEIMDDLGTNEQKLNTAYTYGNPGLHFWDHPSQGPGLLARTLDLNFGLQSDHYIAVSMNVFVEVVDTLGGLDIYLPEGVDGRTSYDRSKRLVFPAGVQHLNGEQALTLARIRNISTFQRTNHQNAVICALQKELIQPDTIAKIPEIIYTFSQHIQTDLTPEQISQLACLGTTMPRSNIIFASFPRELFWPGTIYDPIAKQDVSIYNSDFDIMSDYVTRFQDGSWPATTPSFSTPEPGTSACE